MTKETARVVEDAIFELLQHLGIKQAHFGARGSGDLTYLIARHPALFASLTLVCPGMPSRERVEPLAGRMLVFRGDTSDFDRLGRLVGSLAGATIDTLHGYVNWPGPVACHADHCIDVSCPSHCRAGPETVLTVRH